MHRHHNFDEQNPSFDKALSLVSAHRTDFCEIHPCVSWVRKEGNHYAVDQEWELSETKVRFRTKFAINRNAIALEMTSALVTGTSIIRFEPYEKVRTRVIAEYDFEPTQGSETSGEAVLGQLVESVLQRTYDDYLWYLSAEL